MVRQSRDRLVRLILIDPPVPFLESFLVAPKHIEDVTVHFSPDKSEVHVTRPRLSRSTEPVDLEWSRPR
jgi:hypothetical protein